jgi:hypothetical protein
MIRHLWAVAALIGALALGALAVPRLVAALTTLPSGPALEAARAGERIAEAHLAAAIAASRAALAWDDDAQGHADLALLLWDQARRAGLAGPDGHALAEASRAELDAAIARNPSHPVVWTRRTQIALVLDGIGEGLAADLAMALRTAPYDRVVLIPRLEIALIAWPLLDARQRALVEDQIRMAAVLDVRALARVVRRRFAVGVAREALAGDATAAAAFERAYARAS